MVYTGNNIDVLMVIMVLWMVIGTSGYIDGDGLVDSSNLTEDNGSVVIIF